MRYLVVCLSLTERYCPAFIVLLLLHVLVVRTRGTRVATSCNKLWLCTWRTVRWLVIKNISQMETVRPTQSSLPSCPLCYNNRQACSLMRRSCSEHERGYANYFNGRTNMDTVFTYARKFNCERSRAVAKSSDWYDEGFNILLYLVVVFHVSVCVCM